MGPNPICRSPCNDGIRIKAAMGVGRWEMENGEPYQTWKKPPKDQLCQRCTGLPSLHCDHGGAGANVIFLYQKNEVLVM